MRIYGRIVINNQRKKNCSHDIFGAINGRCSMECIDVIKKTIFSTIRKNNIGKKIISYRNETPTCKGPFTAPKKGIKKRDDDRHRIAMWFNMLIYKV